MVELVYTADLKSAAERIEGSNPSTRTKYEPKADAVLLGVPGGPDTDAASRLTLNSKEYLTLKRKMKWT